MLVLGGLLVSWPGGGVGAARGATGNADWATWGFNLGRTSYNPFEHNLTTATVGRLRQRWAVDLHSSVDTQPIVANNVPIVHVVRIHRPGAIIIRTTSRGIGDLVYAGSEHGRFVAVNAANGQLAWQRSLGATATNCRQTPDKIFGITGAPTLDRRSSTVFVASGKGTVYALDMATGSTRSGWPVRVTSDPVHEHVWGGLAISRGALYVAIGGMCDAAPYHGRIVKISLRTHRVVGRWLVEPPSASGGSIWGWGGVSLDADAGQVFAATGNSLSPPESAAFAEHVVKLDTSLRVQQSNYPGLTGSDVDFGTTPMLYQAPGCPPQLAVLNKDGSLLLYNRNSISSGPMGRVRITTSGELIGVTAYDPVTNMVYLVNPAAGILPAGLVAFRVDSNCQLTLAWVQSAGHKELATSSPIVAGGVVYYGDGFGKQLHAFDAATGEELWNSGNSINGFTFAAPTAVNGSLFAGARDGRLHAFVPR